MDNRNSYVGWDCMEHLANEMLLLGNPLDQFSLNTDSN